MKTQKGITLIALIITIIVMLILVGVSVSVALNTGLFKTAQGAAKNTQAYADKENLLSTGKITVMEDGVEKEKNILDYATLPGTENPGDDESAGHILRLTKGGETFDYPITEATTFESLVTTYPDDFSTKTIGDTGTVLAKWKEAFLVYYTRTESMGGKEYVLYNPIYSNDVVVSEAFSSGKMTNSELVGESPAEIINFISDASWEIVVGS